MLQGDTKLPVIGRVKKAYVYLPLGLAGAYVAWRWYQASRTTEEAPAGSDGLYSSDDLSEYGLSTTGGTGTVTGNTGSTETDGTSDTAIDDNAEWTQKATERLTNAGYDPATTYAALGEFLGRRALDKSEASIARAALAVAGEPPVGRPWSVIEEASTDTGTLPAPTNLRAWDTTTSSQIGMQWDAVPGAAQYRIYRSDLGTEPIGSSFDTKFWAKGLKANSNFSFYVRPVGTTGKEGGKSSTYTAKTLAVKLAKPTGLKASAITRNSFRVSCAAVPGATTYRWYTNGRLYNTSDKPYRDFTGQRPGTAYKVTVAADTDTGEPGPMSGAITVKTKK